MTNGISSSIPDITPLIDLSGSLQGDLGEVLNALGSLDPQDSSSPLALIDAQFGGLSAHVDIDLGPLAEGLPAALQSLQNALPENTLSSLETISQAYQGARDLLQGSPLAQAVTSGASLQEVGLAVIDEARQLFDQHLNDLTGNLIDPQALAALQAFFTSLDQFSSDFPTHQDEFLPFLTDHLLGVAPDVLAAPLAHVQSSLAVLAPLQPESLAVELDPLVHAGMTAFATLQAAVQSLDPADASAYAQLQVHLDDLLAANNLIFPALNTLYTQLDNLIANHAWDEIFSLYVGLLEAISIEDVFSVDDLVNTLVSMLDEMLARLTMSFSADDLRLKLESLNESVHEAILSSPLAQIRPTLQGFLEEIRQAIESIPTESIQEAVDEVFDRIQTELDALNITQVTEQISQAFQDLETFINDNINSAMSVDVQNALSPLAQQVQELPLTSLVDQLTTAVTDLQGVIDQLEQAVNEQLDGLNDLLSQLEDLSFQPVSDEVIVEIDTLKASLEQINPDALSDAEKLAITAGLAVLEAIDLEGEIISGLKTAYHAAEHEIESLLDQLNAALEQLSGKFTIFSPEALLAPLDEGFDQASALVDELNGRNLLSYLYDLLDQLIASLQAFSPGAILDPLQGIYDEIMGQVNRLQPAQWVAPLEALYAEVDQLIDLIDVTPLLEELSNLQNQLFASVSQGITDALDALSLPEPLGSFFDQLRPVLALLTEAVFGDPATQIGQLSLEVRSRVDLTSLFAPLDDAFMQLADLLEQVPADDLTTAMEAIRQTVGFGLEVLNPQNMLAGMRSGYGSLLALAPTNLLGVSLRLPALKLAFELQASTAPPERQADVLAVSARFDLVFSAVSPTVSGGQMQQLVQAHASALQALRERINSLDSSTAQQSYAELRRMLDKVLPDFLRQPDPLTHQDILAGVYAMRPSSKAHLVEHSLEHFIWQAQPYADALEPGINAFFETLRELMSLLNPLDVRDSVAAIYDELRLKVQVIDPAALRQHFEDLLATITTPLEAVNPAQIKAQIDAVYNSALNALTSGVKDILDDVAEVIDDVLDGIKASLQALISQVQLAITDLLGGLQAALDRLEALVFVDILARLGQVIENLGMSFDIELDRVRNAFDEMLAAIPLDTGASVSVSF